MPSRRKTLLLASTLVLAPSLVVGSAQADAQKPKHQALEQGEDLQEYVAGAARLEGRIMAPCCWNQTIDIHGSEPSYELRREIRRRLKAGESADAIEASLVKRYGAKILAVPDTSPLSGIATMLAVGFGAAGVGAYYMLKSWKRRSEQKKPGRAKGDGSASTAEPKRDALDDRLDRELAEIGDQA
jgi:cytochrome c-type biogenesis protein CcmH